MKKRFHKTLLMILGLIISAYAVQSVLRPNSLMTGGITGIARQIETIILKDVPLNPFLEQNLFNIVYYVFAMVILIFAFVFLGKQDGVKIIFISLVYPLFLFAFTYLKVPTLIITISVETDGAVGYFNDLLIPSLVYGMLSGIGTGLILRSGYTSGGSDTIAKIINKKIVPFISIGQILLVFDAIVIFSALPVFGVTIMIYALVSKYANAKAIDMIVLGIGNKRVKMEIITNRIQEVKSFILNKINRGVTLVDAEGAFSQLKTKQLVTICTPKESIQIKNYIASVDTQAFIYIIPSQTVWGRGFRNIVNDEY